MTKKIHSMTLKEFTERESQSKKQAVLNAVVELGNPQVHEIKKLLDSKAYEKARQEYERGYFAFNKLSIETKKNSMDTRTIYRKLQELIKEGLVEHENNRYSVIVKGLLSDHDYIANTYSQIIFPRVWQKFAEAVIHKELEAKFAEAVNILGAFMVYIFIHSLGPAPPDNNQSPNNSHDNLVLFEAKKKLSRLTRGQREYYRKRWVYRAIDTYLMSFCFNGILGLLDFRRRNYVAEKTGEPDMDFTPDFELSTTSYDILMKLFQKKYPLVYNLVKELENRYFREDSPLIPKSNKMKSSSKY